MTSYCCSAGDVVQLILHNNNFLWHLLYHKSLHPPPWESMRCIPNALSSLQQKMRCPMCLPEPHRQLVDGSCFVVDCWHAVWTTPTSPRHTNSTYNLHWYSTYNLHWYSTYNFLVLFFSRKWLLFWLLFSLHKSLNAEIMTIRRFYILLGQRGGHHLNFGKGCCDRNKIFPMWLEILLYLV